ncbi:MAG: 2Fe-2S iron-sulfur cluster binding domain-containing protein, partial [Anaerolineales bacterium]|nr:2Fe-2S iron-sulfur cluster binding domain-containing protein [Anaerolineales bacterium]
MTVNGEERTLAAERTTTLLDALRAAGFVSVKYGCGTGDCGACTVLLDGAPVHSCQVRAHEAEGREVITVEGLSVAPGASWQDWSALHPLQQAFIETGAIQCGYCTPAQLLTAKALLDRNPNPDEVEIREAMSGVLCRCTGYVKIVQAVQRAAALLRGAHPALIPPRQATLAPDAPQEMLQETLPWLKEPGGWAAPTVISPPDLPTTEVVGQPEAKVDGAKLAAGRAVFTDDIALDGMLYGALLTSPHAHARIARIDASRARALPGVHAVLTYQDVPRIKFSSGGQSYPQPPPFDQVALDSKVRHVGDRVAVVAAETPEIARRALALIDVEYEVLPSVLNPEEAMRAGA